MAIKASVKSKTDTPTNVVELRDILARTMGRVLNNELDRPTAQVAANLAGKITQTLRAQIDYAKIRKESPDIEFMNG